MEITTRAFWLLETFEQAGTYDYFCEFHPNMKGTVEVR